MIALAARGLAKRYGNVAAVDGLAPDQLVLLESLRRLRPERFAGLINGGAAAEQEQPARGVATDRGEDRPAFLQVRPGRPLLGPRPAEVHRAVQHR